MAGFNHNASKATGSNQGGGFKSNKPAGNFQGSRGGKASSDNQSGDREIKPTTHYMVTAAGKGEERQFPQGVYITEVGDGLRVYIKEGVQAGTYFINKKKDKSEEAPKFNK